MGPPDLLVDGNGGVVLIGLPTVNGDKLRHSLVDGDMEFFGLFPVLLPAFPANWKFCFDISFLFI